MLLELQEGRECVESPAAAVLKAGFVQTQGGLVV